MAAVERDNGRAPWQVRDAYFGTHLTPCSFEQWLEMLDGVLASGQRRWLCGHHNLHSLYLLHSDAEVRRFYARCDACYIDGMPVRLLLQGLGMTTTAAQRFSLMDHFLDLLRHAERRQWSLYYLGSQATTVHCAQALVQQRFPALRIHLQHGYGSDQAQVVEAINRARPDILLVGMGMPLQERWLLDHLDQLDVGIAAQAGGTLDYYTGGQAKPPRWMSERGLAWLHRLLHDPRRLSRRYLLEPWGLLRPTLRHWLAYRQARDRQPPHAAPQACASAGLDAPATASTPEAPRLSIVVNNYNYARYLPAALDSVLCQLHAQDELIVVDDGSTDASLPLLQQYAATHGIRVLQQPNSGQLRAVCTGVAAARGDVIVLLDSDDCFLDGYLERLRGIYARHPDVTFVFSNARLDGAAVAERENMRALLRRLELPPGRVGGTRWATMLFHEFVGVPTSGLSLHRTLANAILALPTHPQSAMAIPPLLARLLRISTAEQQRVQIACDGFLVRCASLLDAVKYYDARPGFLYRIHGANKYASATRLGRMYLRYRRRAQFVAMIREQLALAPSPTALDLRQEILGRSFALLRRRRLVIRAQYSWAILCSAGSVREKCAALAAALGLRRGAGR